MHKKKNLRVLQIEDDEKEFRIVESELMKVTSQLQLTRVCEEKVFRETLSKDSWDLVLCNYHSKCLEAREALRAVRHAHGDLPFILISGNIGEEAVAALMKEGVDDFLLKGKYYRLEAMVKRVLMDRDIRKKEEKAQRKAFEAFAAKERMLAIVSHDIKNPLSAIHLEAQMLLRTVNKYGKSVMGEEVKIQTGRILKTTDRLRSLIVDLLDKNKGQEGLKSIQKIPVDPVKLIYESLDHVRPLIQEKKITVHYKAPESFPEIPMDRNKMFQVFANLLSNAIKFTPEYGDIHLEMSLENGVVCFSLTDSGRGIGEGENDKIFDKYWTGKKNDGSGTGLGLFICRSIIEAHGGSINCKNVSGKGANFSFTLPVETNSRAAPTVLPGEIIVVDDDEDLCEVISWALTREGYAVRSFKNGEDALSFLQSGQPAPDLLIVDFHLGDMDGRDFLTRLGTDADRCPLIFVSGSPDEVSEAISGGKYHAVVEKPLDLEGLLHEVKILSVPYWQKSGNAASRQLSHGPASVV